jgi:hypothetical protein
MPKWGSVSRDCAADGVLASTQVMLTARRRPAQVNLVHVIPAALLAVVRRRYGDGRSRARWARPSQCMQRAWPLQSPGRIDAFEDVPITFPRMSDLPSSSGEDHGPEGARLPAVAAAERERLIERLPTAFAHDVIPLEEFERRAARLPGAVANGAHGAGG